VPEAGDPLSPDAPTCASVPDVDQGCPGGVPGGDRPAVPARYIGSSGGDRERTGKPRRKRRRNSRPPSRAPVDRKTAPSHGSHPRRTLRILLLAARRGDQTVRKERPDSRRFEPAGTNPPVVLRAARFAGGGRRQTLGEGRQDRAQGQGPRRTARRSSRRPPRRRALFPRRSEDDRARLEDSQHDSQEKRRGGRRGETRYPLRGNSFSGRSRQRARPESLPRRSRWSRTFDAPSRSSRSRASPWW